MFGSIDWQTVSAIVQAASAAAIVLLTVGLVVFTGRYVKEMRRANELQEQANAISSGLLAQETTARRATPFLVAAPGGASGSKGGRATAKIVVQNRGAGVAFDIEIETTWLSGRVPSLAPGDRLELTLTLDTGWDTNVPRILRFRFKDAEGRKWIQEPSQPPIEMP